MCAGQAKDQIADPARTFHSFPPFKNDRKRLRCIEPQVNRNPSFHKSLCSENKGDFGSDTRNRKIPGGLKARSLLIGSLVWPITVCQKYHWRAVGQSWALGRHFVLSTQYKT